MAEWSNNALQTVNPGESVVFTNNPVPCNRGFVQHRDDTGNFQLSGWTPVYSGCNCGCRKRNAVYLVDFGANVAIPTGETVGEISLAITIDGTTIPSSQMIVTPAAVEQYFNVTCTAIITVPQGCCTTVAVENVDAGVGDALATEQVISVADGNLTVTRIA